MSLKRDFENEKIKENGSLNEYFNRLSNLVNIIKSHGDTIEDQRNMDKILISLIEKFDHMVDDIKETKDLSTMTIQGLMGSFRSYEQRLSERNENSIESEFQSKVTIQPNNEKLVLKNNGESYRGGKFARDRGRGENSCERGIYGGRGNFGGLNKWFNICNKNTHEEKECWNKDKP